MITSNKLNTGFLALQIWFLDYFSASRSSAPELESFCRSLPHQIDSTLIYKEGKKEREDGEKGGEGGGRLFERGDYFIYFRLRGGDYPS